MGKIREAIHDITAALTINPHFWDFYNKRAQLYFSLNKYEETLSDYSTSLNSKEPKHRQMVLLNRAQCYKKMGHHESSIRDLEAARDIDPSKPSVHDTLGSAYADNGYLELALASFSYAIELDKDEGKCVSI